ncbi:hypothetical protein DBV15_04183 [Temnothorax longispinosus]|uniref:Uncharacterized protein n=1 Tax=Temnothorax longispinosus TaxID=300112 RepID=A0A4S2KEG3_9HYME|nr:hypothetical protein DBV15_04183 [Temnothorax longispinosus]
MSSLISFRGIMNGRRREVPSFVLSDGGYDDAGQRRQRERTSGRSFGRHRQFNTWPKWFDTGHYNMEMTGAPPRPSVHWAAHTSGAANFCHFNAPDRLHRPFFRIAPGGASSSCLRSRFHRGTITMFVMRDVVNPVIPTGLVVPFPEFSEGAPLARAIPRRKFLTVACTSQQRQEETPGKQRVPLRRRGTPAAEEVTSCESRSRAAEISPVIIPRSWRDAAFGKYARSHTRTAGWPCGKKQSGKRLKGVVSRPAVRSSDCTLRAHRDATPFYCRVSYFSHTPSLVTPLPPSFRCSARFREWRGCHLSARIYIITRLVIGMSISYSQDGSLQYPGNPLRAHPSDGSLPASGEPLTNGSAISSKGETHD